MKIVVSEGLLWEDDTAEKTNIIGCLRGDEIARANGFVYVEQVVRNYPERTVLTLDDGLKIVTYGPEESL